MSSNFQIIDMERVVTSESLPWHFYSVTELVGVSYANEQ